MTDSTPKSARRIRWFSAGAASAVATKLDVDAYGIDAGPVCYIDTGAEHSDNPRFLADVCAWLGVELTVLRSEKYESTWQVWEERRFLNGPDGALCTTEMKKVPRFAFQRPDDVHVFGYTFDPKDRERAQRFVKQNPGVEVVTPLIERDLTKADCLSLVASAGITLPTMYLLGYQNNNCVGCVKGGMGYWNKIRRDFPDVFARMAAQERAINHSVIHTEKEGMIFLDTLDPDRGDDTPVDMSCSFACAGVESQWTKDTDG